MSRQSHRPSQPWPLVAVAGLVGAFSGTPASGAGAPAGCGLRGQPGAVQREPEPRPTTRTPRPRCRTAEYKLVALTNLDGSGYLRGDWANVVTQTGKPVSAKTGYVFNRHEDRLRAGDGLLLGHPGAGVPAEPRLRCRRRQVGLRCGS